MSRTFRQYKYPTRKLKTNEDELIEQLKLEHPDFFRPKFKKAPPISKWRFQL